MVSMNGNGQSPRDPRKVTGIPLFHPGVVLVTPGAAEVIARLGIHPVVLLARHVSGDWGDIASEDQGVNEAALKYDARILSVYKFGPDTLWVITEADRESTTILLPSEY